MGQRFLFLEDLHSFFIKQNQDFSLDPMSGDEIVVQIPETMTFADDYDPQSGLLRTHLKSCHLYRNRNDSFISDDAMNQAIPSFYNRPILGKIHQLKDGSYDFAGHAMTIDEDGNVEYQEIPLGVIPESCNAKLVYDEENDKTYLEVDGYIYEEYTRAADILREKKKSKVSVEIAIRKMSYSAKDKVLNIEEFYFRGITILGCTEDDAELPINEGMEGANITLADFNINNNSIFTDNGQKLVEALERFNTILSNFNINGEVPQSITADGKEETSLVKLNELLAKYNKTIDDITFDYENMSDEELETAFAENFELGSGKNDPIKPVKYSIEMSDGEVRAFDLSLNDIQSALHSLVNSTYGETDNAWYFVNVYPDSEYVIMEDYWSGTAYKQSYSKEDENFSLTGDRVQVYANWLTKEEENTLKEMRDNYSRISNELDKYVLKDKESIFTDPTFSALVKNPDFVELKKNMNKYSIQEIQEKCDAIYGRYCKANSTGVMFDHSTHKPNSVSINTPQDKGENTYSPYGRLFEEFEKK